jgi:hypothetical protein
VIHSNDAVIALLAALTRGGKWRGNPYCSPLVKAVLVEIAAERGRKDWMDALNGLPAYDDYKGAE